MYNLSRSDYLSARQFLLAQGEDLSEFEPNQVINLANHVYEEQNNGQEAEE